MAQYQVTLDDKQFEHLFSVNGLKPLLEETLNELLKAQVSECIQADPHERTPEH